MSGYTPTTEEVRDDYIAYQSSEIEDFTGDPIPEFLARERFLRWYTEEIRKAREQGRKAGYLEYDTAWKTDTEYPYEMETEND